MELDLVGLLREIILSLFNKKQHCDQYKGIKNTFIFVESFSMIVINNLITCLNVTAGSLLPHLLPSLINIIFPFDLNDLSIVRFYVQSKK